MVPKHRPWVHTVVSGRRSAQAPPRVTPEKGGRRPGPSRVGSYTGAPASLASEAFLWTQAVGDKRKSVEAFPGCSSAGGTLTFLCFCRSGGEIELQWGLKPWTVFSSKARDPASHVRAAEWALLPQTAWISLSHNVGHVNV